MRKIAATIVACASLVLFAATRGEAAAPDTPEPVKPKPVPTIEPRLERPPYIESARRTPLKGLASQVTAIAYGEGPLSFDVEIVNPPSTALETSLVVERLEGGPAEEIARVPVEVPAGGRAFATFADPRGLKDGCASNRLRVSLQTGTSSRTLKMTPSCAFASDPVDPGAQLPEARRVEQQSGRLSYHAPRLASSSLACGEPITVRATARNGASTTATGARLRIEGPSVDGVSDRFDLGPGKERVVTATLPSFGGVPGSYVLRIDPAGSVPVHQPGWNVKVTRSCRVDVDLER
jgi:hypothetical protein